MTTITEKLERLMDDPAQPMTWTKCFAVPGSETIIDIVHPTTGLSMCYGKTLADARAEYPGAELMDVEAHCKSKATRQDAPGVWIETTEERYDEMLNVLPPASWVRYAEGRSGFLVGEAVDHHATNGSPRFDCFKRENGQFHTFSRPMTFKEFKSEFGETARYGYCE